VNDLDRAGIGRRLGAILQVIRYLTDSRVIANPIAFHDLAYAFIIFLKDLWAVLHARSTGDAFISLDGDSHDLISFPSSNNMRISRGAKILTITRGVYSRQSPFPSYHN
jgi:hypothetical protein